MGTKHLSQPGLNGPPMCCGLPSLFRVQGMVTRTMESPPNDPPTYFAAGAWRCAEDSRHHGSWIHRTTDPGRYLAAELRERLGEGWRRLLPPAEDDEKREA